MFCMKCGKALGEGDAFCQFCGTKVWTKSEKETPIAVGEEKSVEPKVVPVAKETPVELGFAVAPTQTSENTNNEGEREKAKKKSPKTGKKKVAIIVAIVVAVAIIVGVVLGVANCFSPCSYCGRYVYSVRLFYIENPDGMCYSLCDDCYNSDSENEVYREAAANPNDDTYDKGVNVEDTDVVTEDTPVTPAPETEPPVPTEYVYSGQTFTFRSPIYMGDFTEDHSNDNLQFYEWKGDEVEVEVEVYTVPENFDGDAYMLCLEDLYGDEIYTETWMHSTATAPLAYNMSVCWESNGVDVIMNTDNYLYVFQIFSDYGYYQNELYSNIDNVEINE